MKKYGEAFYGSDELHIILGRQLGEWKSEGNQDWQCSDFVTFSCSTTLYKLPIAHWFYNSYQFEQAKKPLADYSDDDEILQLARKVCADSTNASYLRADFIKGTRDKTTDMRLAKAAVIAGMKLQKEISQ